MTAQANGDRSVAAGYIHTLINGDHTRVVLSADATRSAEQIPAPPGLANLPAPATGVFVGREEVLERLARELELQPGVALTQARAVHGLGGVGKSTVALHYAHRNRARYSLVWWINAESADTTERSLAALAHALNPSWAHGAPVEEKASWALQWLQWHPGWLLVHDNVEDPEHLRPLLGMLPDGHHLATSRRATGWNRIARTVALDVLSPGAAVELLCTIALDGEPPTPEERTEAAALAADLGYLPLALEQAGAYLNQTQTGFAEYRSDLKLLFDEASDGIDPERTIARIWDLTLAVLATRDELAVKLLRTLAWYAPEDVPRTLFAAVFRDRVRVDQALGNLRAFSLVGLTRSTVSVHRLVQAVLRDKAVASGANAWREEAEMFLCLALPPHCPDGGPSWAELLPHVQALAATRPSEQLSEAAESVYSLTADHLRAQGYTERALPLLNAVITGRTDAQTPADGALRTRSKLAAALSAAGQHEAAIEAATAVIAGRERLLGGDHPDTLLARNNLAAIHIKAGDHLTAADILGPLAAQCATTIGPAHLTTLDVLDNLAGVFRALDNGPFATQVMEAVVAGRTQLLGPDHPRTLASRNNLALACEEHARAVDLLEALVADRERVLGPDHPHALETRHNLGVTLLRLAEYGRAAALFDALAADRERVLGPDHPRTQGARWLSEAARRVIADPRLASRLTAALDRAEPC